MNQIITNKSGTDHSVTIVDNGDNVRLQIHSTENPRYFDIQKVELRQITSVTSHGDKDASIEISKKSFGKMTPITSFSGVASETAAEFQQALEYAKKTFAPRSFTNGGIKWFSFGTIFGVVLFYVIAVIAYDNPQIENASQTKNSANTTTAEEWKP